MTDKKGPGRPATYKADFAKQAQKLCALGAINRDLADFFEVTERTIERWAVKHEEFGRALKVGKELPDQRVERALYQRAIGYSHPDIDIRVVNGEIVETPFIKHYPPDTKAALAWLYNRQSDNWHPRPELRDGDEDGTVIPVKVEIVAKDAGRVQS